MVLRLIYLIPFFISVTLSLWVATYCFKKRSETGALAYALIAFSQAIWIFGYIFELSGNSGHQIIEAETPLRGLELASQIPEIDLLRTDVVLP